MRVLSVLLVSGIVLLFGQFRPMAGVEVGDKAIPFNLKGVDGKKVSLGDFSGENGVILIFTCNTCPYSKMYEDRIIALHNDYAPKGYPVVAINPNDPVRQPGDSFDEMVKRSDEKNFPFPYLFDSTQEIAEAYGATRTPHVFLINNKKGGTISYIGAIDNNHLNADEADKKYVRQAVDQINSGNDVSTKSTKAIGCTIKWKES